ncbi:MAG: ThuA domain-containing protein [Akkermansiaceae bacterium]|nr:ThuA domain-containing protein [Akkermansiaceae bacterium]
MKNMLGIPFLLVSGLLAVAAEETPPIAKKIVPPTAEWKAKIASLAPAKPRVAPKSPRKVLVSSLATGYCHDVIPHVKEVMDVLAATGAFEVVHSNEIDMFTPAQLKQFDAVVLNNACTKNPKRNWFIDVLATHKDLTDEQRLARAAELEQSLTDFVAGGKGLIAVHGAVVFLNNSENFGKMLGGSFSLHPACQRITLTPVDPKHPLVAAFKGEPFIHTDEPYLFFRAYNDKNFRPLLEMDVAKLDPQAQTKMKGDHRYVSWIKPHGKGRVFYVSPSHQPESYESARMLQFYLDGLQYALGDLACDDSPIGK